MQYTDADVVAFCEQRLKYLREDRDITVGLYLTREVPISSRRFIEEMQQLDNQILTFERIHKDVTHKLRNKRKY
jgi:hypothetical protein